MECIVMSDRRKNEVALETERSLAEAKQEMCGLKRELIFMTQARSDLEKAYSAVQEEKRLLDRELLSVRAQLVSNGRTGGALSARIGSFMGHDFKNI